MSTESPSSRVSSSSGELEYTSTSTLQNRVSPSRSQMISRTPSSLPIDVHGDSHAHGNGLAVDEGWLVQPLADGGDDRFVELGPRGCELRFAKRPDAIDGAFDADQHFAG